MKLCIAGTSAITTENRELVEEIPYVLESFIYVKDWQYPIIKKAKLFLLDSGGFTFIFSYKKEITEEVINEYLQRYIDFINEQDVKYFFNLDLDTVIGVEKTEELRRRLEKGTGKKCIPVWHKCMGLESWKKLTKEYDYVAIGTIKEWTSYPLALKKLNQIAKKNHCKVHGLGYTKTNAKELGFYSVDSTSWKSGNMYGRLMIFKHNKMTGVKLKNKRLKSGDMYSVVEKHCLQEWLKYQKYLDRS